MAWREPGPNTLSGFVPIADLRERLSDIPVEPGVYMVLAPDGFTPDFVHPGRGGHFKGADPNVAIEILEANWVIGTSVLYIGKAARGKRGIRGLRKRISEYLQFGAGRPVGHRGGRYIWQMRDCDRLLVAWRVIYEAPEKAEVQLLARFRDRFGSLPFANLRH